jgi:hypothetical protein
VWQLRCNGVLVRLILEAGRVEAGQPTEAAWREPVVMTRQTQGVKLLAEGL